MSSEEGGQAPGQSRRTAGPRRDQDVRLRPTIDPTINGVDWDLLRDSADVLVPATQAVPGKAELYRPYLIAALGGLELAAAGLGGSLLLVYLVANSDELPGLGSIAWGAQGPGRRTGAGLGLGFDDLRRGTRRRSPGTDSGSTCRPRFHHGRYFLPADFDEESRALLARAQRAVDAVLDSAVHEAGLLDDIQNSIVLPEQEWEIAHALREVTRLRAGHRSAEVTGSTSRIAAVLDPQREALRLAVDALIERVKALETYAERARDADRAYHEWRRIREISAGDEDARELLARTVRDRLAQSQIIGLAERASRVEVALEQSVDDANRATGQILTLASRQRLGGLGPSGWCSGA